MRLISFTALRPVTTTTTTRVLQPSQMHVYVAISFLALSYVPRKALACIHYLFKYI